MAENDEDSLIGYDPLAWMHEAGDKVLLDPELPILEAGQEPNLTPQATPESVDLEPNAENWSEAAESEPTGLNVFHLSLEPVQGIQNVLLLHEQLIRALDSCQKIEIDASATTQIDTATLQLLLVLKRTAVNLQREVMIDFPSDKFVEAAKLLGLAEMLEVDQAAAGFF